LSFKKFAILTKFLRVLFSGDGISIPHFLEVFWVGGGETEDGVVDGKYTTVISVSLLLHL
jgi:hypothetical protein